VSGFSFQGIIGESMLMREVFRLITEAAGSDVNVLIKGESGTGKDLVAHTIHNLSRRKGEPFLPVSTSGMPANMVPSQLFGHEREAFTGAISSKKGYFEIARGGTLFIDEISATEESIQICLLRVLETKTLKRVGGGKMIKVNARLIAATNKNLWREVLAGKFREDLLFRLEVFPITLPSLRDRREDLPHLAEHFLRLYNKEYGRRIKKISADAMEVLLNCEWPGNVRELQNTVQRAILVCEDNVITPDHLPPRLITGDHHDGAVQINIGTSLQEAEKRIIEKTFVFLGGNKNETARVLGISRKSLRSKMFRYGISAPLRRR
jgi:DNA-binding NtrC family response regulator